MAAVTSGRGQGFVPFPWWAVLIQGIAAVVLGLFFLFRPGISTVLLVQFIAIWWFVSGIFTLVMLFQDRSMWGWKMFSGFLGIIVGLMVIAEPLVSTVVVGTVYVVIIAIQGLVIGLFDIVHAFRGGGWGIGAIGVLSVLFGILLLMQPIAAALVIPVLLGVLGIAFGTAATVSSFGLKREQAQGA